MPRSMKISAQYIEHHFGFREDFGFIGSPQKRMVSAIIPQLRAERMRVSNFKTGYEVVQFHAHDGNIASPRGECGESSSGLPRATAADSATRFRVSWRVASLPSNRPEDRHQGPDHSPSRKPRSVRLNAAGSCAGHRWRVWG